MKPGRLVVISGPSGVGKSSICERLLGMTDLDARLSVSVTTRPPRPGEVDGEHYRFLGREEFDRLVKAGDLLESAEVFGHRYGTPRAPVDEGVRDGRVVLLDIDVQGGRQLREKGVDALYVFIVPPSMEALEERLRGRRTEAAEALRRRLDGARKEMEAQKDYDCVFVNDDLERVTAEVRGAILSWRERGSPDEGK